MRVDPECVYLRLEPGATVINWKTGATRSVPVAELHWKDGRKWEHRSFVGESLGGVLREIGDWLDEAGDLEAALDTLRGTTTDGNRPSPASEAAPGAAGRAGTHP